MAVKRFGYVERGTELPSQINHPVGKVDNVPPKGTIVPEGVVCKFVTNEGISYKNINALSIHPV
jgi:hypothetical protein